jgi:hypothetical protein
MYSGVPWTLSTPITGQCPASTERMLAVSAHQAHHHSESSDTKTARDSNDMRLHEIKCLVRITSLQGLNYIHILGNGLPRGTMLRARGLSGLCQHLTKSQLQIDKTLNSVPIRRLSRSGGYRTLETSADRTNANFPKDSKSASAFPNRRSAGTQQGGQLSLGR